MRFSKRVIVSMLVFLLIFTIAILYVHLKTGNEPSTLVTAVFAFCSFEGGYLALIKSVEKTKEAPKKASKTKKKK